jgi:hypothetical protein
MHNFPLRDMYVNQMDLAVRIRNSSVSLSPGTHISSIDIPGNCAFRIMGGDSDWARVRVHSYFPRYSLVIMGDSQEY